MYFSVYYTSKKIRFQSYCFYRIKGTHNLAGTLHNNNPQQTSS